MAFIALRMKECFKRISEFGMSISELFSLSTLFTACCREGDPAKRRSGELTLRAVSCLIQGSSPPTLLQIIELIIYLIILGQN